jgi:hypothetical protein
MDPLSLVKDKGNDGAGNNTGYKTRKDTNPNAGDAGVHFIASFVL